MECVELGVGRGELGLGVLEEGLVLCVVLG